MQVLVYRQAALAASAVLVGAQLAMAQPTLTIAPNAVAPGDAVSATVTGAPGHYFAVVGSSVNAGATHGGLTLAVGTDYVLLAYGTLDGGRAIIGVRPPFHGSALDRYYLQAATSPSAMMLPAAVSPGVVVRNADLVTGLQGPTGPPGPMGPPGPPFPTNETGAFDLFNDHGIVAGGMHEPSGTDMVPLLVWYPKKAAFRVGSAGAAGWDREMMGDHSVAMGSNTNATGMFAAALGIDSTAAGFASLAAGLGVRASGYSSTAFGIRTAATAYASTALGTDTVASAIASTAMGAATIASGLGSTALGMYASTNSQLGSFVYGDGSTLSLLTATAPNQFAVRAAGGFRFRTAADLSTGCDLPAGSGVFTCASSRHTKNAVRPVDTNEVLVRLRSVPVNSWSYTGEAGVRHMGPFAEDFRAAFGLGVDDASIGLLDIDGVSLAAIQALDVRTERLLRVIEALQTESAALRAENRALQTALDDLRATIAELQHQRR